MSRVLMYHKLDDTIGFGKCKNKFVWWVLEDDLSYMTWLLEHTELVLDDEAYLRYQELLAEKEQEREYEKEDYGKFNEEK